MKLIIDIEPRYCKDMRSDVKGLYYEAIDRIIEAVSNGIPYEEKPQSDLISRDALKKALHNFFDGKVINEPAYILRDVFCYIDGAQTLDTSKIEHKSYNEGFKDGVDQGIKLSERPQGGWIFRSGGYYKCNRCGEVERAEKNYCSNCGARMIQNERKN